MSERSVEFVKTEHSFSDLNISPSLINRCSALGIHHPTPVQYYSIPKILEGHDCICTSQTGTGKTIAFALPVLQKLFEDPYGIFALVLTPTRELAFQIADQFRVLGKSHMLQVSIIVGGMDMVAQGKEISSKPHVVIATPGRLADHLNYDCDFSFKRIKFLVLDEADRLLEGHFTEQLQVIFEALPKKRQTLLFSATMTETLEELKNISTTNPFIWSSDNDVTVKKLDQRYVLTPPATKDAYFVYIVNRFQEKYPESMVMVFTRTCKTCQVLSIALNRLGLKNVTLNSSLSQKERLSALSKFKSGTIKLLIATDVASRGLDIPAVDLVINHNVPAVSKDYVHRVGRTARADKEGMAITLITQYDIKRLYAIEKLINTKLVEYKTKEKEVLDILLQVNVAVREAGIILEEKDFGVKKAINKRKKQILDELDFKPKSKKKKV